LVSFIAKTTPSALYLAELPPCHSKKKIRKKQRQTSFSRDAPLYHTELPPFSWYKATQQRKKHRTDVSKSKTA
jgi:hypothetical protein